MKTIVVSIAVLAVVAGAFVFGMVYEQNNYVSTYDVDEKIRFIEDRLDNLDVISMGKVYDANDAIYKYIPEAPADWTEKFGVNERTRLIHSISELRVVVAAQGKRLLALEEPEKAE